MKVGLYHYFMTMTNDVSSQVATARAHGVEYISNLPPGSFPSGNMPELERARKWKEFIAPSPNPLHGIGFWRMLASKGLHFSVLYLPVHDESGIDWQKKAIDEAIAQGCAPHDLLVGHEVSGNMTQAQRQATYEEAKQKYPTIPIRPYYGSWKNPLARPNQRRNLNDPNSPWWIEYAPCASRRECDFAGVAAPYYNPNPPSKHSYAVLQTDNPGELWTRLELEQAHSFQMPYAKIALHVNVMKEWLLNNEEYRLTLRQFQRDLRPDPRYAILMWRVLEGESFDPEKRVDPGSPPSGDWTPELWEAISFISEA